MALAATPVSVLRLEDVLRTIAAGRHIARALPEALLSLVLVFVLAAATGISSPLRAEDVAANTTAASGFAPGEVLVRYRSSATRRDIARLEASIAAQHSATIEGIGVRVLSVPPGAEERAIAALERSPHVKFAERNAVASASDTIPNDPGWVNQWSAVKTRAPAAWDVTTGSASVVVAVLDTGVDPTHPDLQGKLTAGRDFVNDDNDPSDDHGHGTAVAGIIGAVTNNSRGVAAYCWECRVMPVKVLGSGGAGWHSDIADGIAWAADNGARVINMSLAGASGTKTLESAIRYADRRGVVIVASAGNSGSTTPTYPAAYPEVIGVAGSNQYDTFYSWSNRGPWVDVAAPGSSYTTMLGGSYGMFNGTSSAAPVVAGITGLAFSFAPGATSANVKWALFESAVNIGDGVAYGRVDTLGTLAALGAPTDPAPGPSATPVPSAEPTPGTEPTPQPEPTASASPTPTPSASPTPQPEPSPEGTETMTKEFRGSLNAKSHERAYSVATGSGVLRGMLEFNGETTLTIVLLPSTGAEVAQFHGESVLTLEATTSAGTQTVLVRGDGTRTNFRLTLTYTKP